MATMSDREIQLAAISLAEKLCAPIGSLSVRSDTSQRQTGLNVSLTPAAAYLLKYVPSLWQGFPVKAQIAKAPKAR